MDEFGYRPFTPAAHPLFQLVRRRYDRGSVLIASNRVAGDWKTALADQIVATAIVNRLLHHGPALTIRDNSYQLRKKRRSRPLKAPPAPALSGPSQSQGWMDS